ncbi:MAG TPA: formyltransferase family protein [Gaiellaceae bacterium]|nr:formyltransferase family protein [Gaiellaceae bacterium]
MAQSWRVAIISQVAVAAQGYTEILRALGHEPVVHLAVRRVRPDLEPPPQVRDFLTRTFKESPPDLDLVFPAHSRSLAPLLRAYDVDLAICTGFPWRIPADALAVPRLGIVNGHPSLLPRYRGPIPVAWAVRNGDTEFGLTYHLMDEQFDTGNVLAQAPIPFDDEWSFEELNSKLAGAAAELVPIALGRLAAGDRGDPQTGGDYHSLFEDEYMFVDLSKPAADVQRQARAWNFAFSRGPQGPILERDGGRIRLVRTSLTEVEGAERLDCADAPLWIVESEPAQESLA